MNSVERVKNLCKKRRIPISRLERELGYANGYISQLRRGVLPDDRLAEIAAYLSVSVQFLISGTEEAPVPGGGRALNCDDFEYALLNEAKLLPDEKKKMLLEMARFMKADMEKEK